MYRKYFIAHPPSIPPDDAETIANRGYRNELRAFLVSSKPSII